MLAFARIYPHFGRILGVLPDSGESGRLFGPTGTHVPVLNFTSTSRCTFAFSY
eukprot:SAG31_NODE_35563_length_322_cov_0.448430_1_plen_52_part_01